MGKGEVWETLPSFRMWPKKTFFGLDKNNAHCFKVPKELTEECISLYDLGAGNLQTEIIFSSGGIDYPAEIRLARLKLRNAIFFQWPKFNQTILLFRTSLGDSYTKTLEGEVNDSQSIDFFHAEGSMFILRFNNNE